MNDTKFELTLMVRDSEDSFKFKSVDTIKSDDLVHLLSQFMIVLVKVQKEYYEKQITDAINGGVPDDIPF